MHFSIANSRLNFMVTRFLIIANKVISGRRERIRGNRRNLEDGGGPVVHTSRASAL